MSEKFSRTSYDNHGVSKTEYDVEDSRSKTENLDAAAVRIAWALSGGKEFVLPGEIVNKNGVSLRKEDLRGDFTTIVRMVILHQTRQEIIDQLEDTVCFTPGDITGETEPTGNEDYIFGLCENFYLTRLPYMEALKIFIKSIATNYFRELMRRYPNDPKKRAELAGMSQRKLKDRMSGTDLSKSPLPVSYNLRPFQDDSFPTIGEICDTDDKMFSRVYIDSLKKRTGNNFEEMLKLSGTTREHLGGLLRRFP